MAMALPAGGLQIFLKRNKERLPEAVYYEAYV